MSGQTLLPTSLTMTPLLLAAICANVVIFVAKLVTYLFSGSRYAPARCAAHVPWSAPCAAFCADDSMPCSSILAETVHSVVDTFNQVRQRAICPTATRIEHPSPTPPPAHAKLHAANELATVATTGLRRPVGRSC